MCFSAAISYSTSAVLITTGLYAVSRARRLTTPYLLLAMVPLMFGIQQGLEGRVWQELDAGRADAALPFALGFHFFSHFLWLWWLPLCSFLLETGRRRRRLFLGLGIFGAVAGGLVFFALLLHPEALSVKVYGHSILYKLTSPYRGPFSIPIPASALYGLIILIPLLFSSLRHLRIFGVLTLVSIVVASFFYGKVFVSVWCFFAAALSLYIVYMITTVHRDAVAARLGS